MKRRFKKTLKWLVVLALLVLLVVVGPPVVFLLNVWWHDQPAPLTPSPGANDMSGLNPSSSAEVIPLAAGRAAAEQQVADLVRRAAKEGRPISISGAQHSMGGHTLYPGGLVLDMKPFREMSLDVEHRLLQVDAGARWAAVIPYLDQHGFAVAVMQSNNDFTVGGSISVNCHGWQLNAPPIASTVEGFRLVTATGAILHCSRTENTELFSLVLGGYGLFGVILDVDLRVVPNEFYRAESRRVKPADYVRVYDELTGPATDIGLAYGRISVAPDSFLDDGLVVVFRRQATEKSVQHTLTDDPPGLLKRLVFRGSVGSDYGKNLRWRLELLSGETGAGLLSRNQIMNEPADWYENRVPTESDILQEYFVPAAKLAAFVQVIKPVLLRRHPDLLNITLREVAPDPDTFLRYARERVFAVVMYFHQQHGPAAEAAMQDLTRDLIDAALDCGGAYYLPYRPHATLAQFERAYPMAREFFARKRTYDPTDVFANQFFINYGQPLLTPAKP